MSVTFSDGFESGDFSQWTAATTDGGDLSVEAAAARNGAYGAQYFFDDTALLQLRKDFVSALTQGGFTFDFNANGLSFASASEFRLCKLGVSPSTGVIRVLFQYQDFPTEGLFIFVIMRDTTGTDSSVSFGPVDVSDWHRITVDFTLGSGGAGGMNVYLDSVLQGSVSGLNTVASADRILLHNTSITSAITGDLWIDNVAVADDPADDIDGLFDPEAEGQIGGFWVTLRRN